MPHDRLVAAVCLLSGAMVLAAVLALRSRIAAVLLIFLALAWLNIDKYFEGPVLWSLDRTHGLTLADVPALIAGLVGLVLLVISPLGKRRSAVPRVDPTAAKPTLTLPNRSSEPIG